MKSLYNYNVKEDEGNKDLSDESIDEDGELNDLINDWWFVDKKEENENTNITKENINEKGFNIDYEPKLKNKKRNYNAMKGNIIKKLYEDEDESFFGLNQPSFKYN